MIILPIPALPTGITGLNGFPVVLLSGSVPGSVAGRTFTAKVNNKYDPQHGYNGPTPQRGEKPAASKTPAKFHGNETRDGRGHTNKK
jgi:hypothetical protein